MFKKSSSLAVVSIVSLSLLSSSSALAHGLPLLTAIQDVEAKLDAMVVPFQVTDSTGGLCDSAGPGTSNPEILINSDGADGEFVVTSILIKTASPGVPLTGFRNFLINEVQIDNEIYDAVTGNLVGPTDGTGVLESVDIMGTPVRRNSDADAPLAGGNFPHQIVAHSEGTDDIRVRFFCSSTDDDLSFDTILVAGWKRPADTITVTLVPGN